MGGRAGRAAAAAFVLVGLLPGCASTGGGAAADPPTTGGAPLRVTFLPWVARPVPSASPSAAAVPTTSPSPTPLPSASPAPVPTRDPCDTWQRSGLQGVLLTLTPGRGAIGVRWWADGDPDVELYRFTAIPQRPGAAATPVRWTSVPAPAHCRPQTLTAQLSGLRSGELYEVWVDVVYTAHEGTTGTVNRMRGRASTITR